jgi:hypothetical protein
MDSLLPEKVDDAVSSRIGTGKNLAIPAEQNQPALVGRKIEPLA